MTGAVPNNTKVGRNKYKSNKPYIF